MLRSFFPACLLLGMTVSQARADDVQWRWWPTQKPAPAFVQATDYSRYPPVKSPDGRLTSPGRYDENGPYHVLVQSVAGLAALAVNESRGDELVWIGTSHNIDYQDWYARLPGRRQMGMRGVYEPWDLVQRYIDRGLIKGYVLYAHDFSAGDNNQHRVGMDQSVNVATSVAGFLDAILVEQGLETEAQRRGLNMLLDAREKTLSWAFEEYRDRYNRRLLVTQDPKKPHLRDLAIAQHAFTTYGYEEPTPSAMEWLEPLSPIAGWNGGDEDDSTMMSTQYGHIQTATDWCLNLPILMAGTESTVPPKAAVFDPTGIDWSDKRCATAFVITDGDNVQWYMGGFYRQEAGSWWTSPDRGRFPFGWSCPFAHLAQVCPEAIEYAAETQSANCWMIEWGGGYYYPDYFASKRENRWELLAEHARRTWHWMEATGTRSIGFNVMDLDSPDALKAYDVIAGAMDGWAGIFVFQYYPYEGGEGAIYWTRDAAGNAVPVVSARNSLWENSDRPRSGTPAKVARLINEDADADDLCPQWTITHAWSWFRPAPGSDEAAENMPQAGADQNSGIRGLTPVGWCADRLQPGVRVVPPEEMFWRLRMAHDPDETRRLLELDQ